jgi:putative endonuclease
MYFIYILKSRKDSLLYTGYTSNLRKRLLMHNNGKITSTKSRVPLDLIYYEACTDMLDARARERYLKSGMGKRYIKNRLKSFFLNK